MAKCGRRPVLDEIKRREIVAILSMGCTRRAAANYVGCAPSTIRRTARRDDNFARQLRHAESQSEVRHVKNINTAAEEARYWRASAWVLERKFPDEYGVRGPDVITVEQILLLLTRFAEIVAEEVPEEKTRQRILERLDELTASLREPSPDEPIDEPPDEPPDE